jgi:2-iminobutanoate/2-iminopropanoate deaminase
VSVAGLAITAVDASTVERPANYAQSLEVSGAERLLFVSGQVPCTFAGAVPEGFEAQARLVWSNVLAQLNAAEMGLDNLVKVTTFLADRQHAEANRRVRDDILGSRRIALTVIICSIFDEAWLLEIEAIAAA